MPRAKLTCWYPAGINPCRPGWYDYEGFGVIPKTRMWWSGKGWRHNDRPRRKFHIFEGVVLEGDRWRGLTEKAK